MINEDATKAPPKPAGAKNKCAKSAFNIIGAKIV